MVLSLFCFVILLRVSSVPVTGDYVVEVTVESYDGMENKVRFSSEVTRCCDDFRNNGVCNGEDRCDTYFTYCLRVLNTSQFLIGGCVGPTLLSNVNVDGAAINFSQPTVLGLPNPLTLPGLSADWQGAQIYVEVIDRDPPDDDNNPDDLVNIFIITLSSNMAIETIRTSTSVGRLRVSTITIRSRVLCSEFYYGDRCELLNECELNNVTCSGRGRCVDGVDNYTCDCDPGYTGRDCEQLDHCLDVTCSDRGTCQNGVSSHTCICNPSSGYTGRDCNVDIDECSLMESVCSGRGNCFNELGSFRCSCEAGFTGRVCEVDIDECIGVTCNGRGNCTDRVNGFVCACLPGYTGDECETDINECEGQDCSGNGQCADLVGTFECDCLPGYTGSLCETNIDDCVGVNCSGNGQCVDRVNSYSCVCDSGYMGDQCNINIQAQRAGAGEVAGGVIGGLLALVLLVLLIVTLTVFLIRRAQRKSTKLVINSNGVSRNNEFTPGDNPTYGVALPAPHKRTVTVTSEAAEFDNPIYGSNQSLNDAELNNPLYGSNQSLNDAELNNPIYADADFDGAQNQTTNGVSANEALTPTVYETPCSSTNNESIYQNV